MDGKQGSRRRSAAQRSRHTKWMAGHRLCEKEEVGILRRAQDTIRKRESRKLVEEVLNTDQNERTRHTLSEIRGLGLSVESLKLAGLKLIRSVVASVVVQLKSVAIGEADRDCKHSPGNVKKGKDVKVEQVDRESEVPPRVKKRKKETVEERRLRMRLEKRAQREKQKNSEMEEEYRLKTRLQKRAQRSRQRDTEVVDTRGNASTTSPKSFKKRKGETDEERRLRMRLEKRAQREKQRSALSEEEYRLRWRLQKRAQRQRQRIGETGDELRLKERLQKRAQRARKRESEIADRLNGVEVEGLSKEEMEERRLLRLKKNSERDKELVSKERAEMVPISLNNGAVGQLYGCIVCDEEFDSTRGLKTHFLHHTESEVSVAKEKHVVRKGEDNFAGTEFYVVNVYKCEECSEKFYTMQNYRKHVLDTHKEHKEFLKKMCFVCGVCEEAFIARKKLIEHVRNKHNIFTQCPVCNENVQTQEVFAKHLSLMHSDCKEKDGLILGYADGSFCKICGFSSESYRNVLSHCKEHLEIDKEKVDDERLFVCELCGKIFRNNQSLRIHGRRHSGVLKKKNKKKVECKVCGKSFTTNFSYKGHYLAAHTDIRAFQCQICGRTFKSQPSLHFHKVSTCEKEKAIPKPCPICGKILENYLLLGYHKANFHKFGNTDESFCHVCNKRMNSPMALHSHNKNVHTMSKKKKYFAKHCAVCGKNIPKPMALFEHWRIHREETPFKCNLCPTTFKYCIQFSLHKKRMHRDELEYAKLTTDKEIDKKLREDFQRDHAVQFIENVIDERNLVSTVETADPGNNLNLRMESNYLTNNYDCQALVHNGASTINGPSVETNNIVVSNNIITGFDTAGTEMIHSDKTYIDFSRANVPVVLEREERGPGVQRDNIPESQNTFNEENGNSGSAELTEPADEDWFSFGMDEPPLSPVMEYFDDCELDTEQDKKPSIHFQKDPFKKQLVMKIEKLKECLVCEEYFPTSKLYEEHLGSKSHRAARRTHKKEARSIKRAYKKKINKNKSKPQKKNKSKSQKKEDETKDSKGLFPCPFCSETFSNLESYRRHVPVHKPRAPCLLCDEKFASVRKLVDHYIANHNSEKTVKCDLCDKVFINYKIASSNNGLLVHMKYQHGGKKQLNKPPKTYNCDLCGEKKIATMKLLRIHLLSHNDDKYKCVHCTEEFPRAIELENHYNETHSGDMPFPCVDCTQKFSTAFRLSLHSKEVHPQQRSKDFVCEDCGKPFLRACGLANHKERHHKPSEERRKFVCELCGKSFLTNQGLSIHGREHTGEKPYQCASCGDAFSSSTNLKRHMESVHHTVNNICDVCGKSFTNSSNLTAHRRLHSPDKGTPCPHCSKIFCVASRLKKHIEDVHVGGDLNTPYTCPICSQTFYKPKVFKRHMDLHDPSRPFACAQCPKRFKHQSNLRVHRIEVHEKIRID